MKLGFNEATCMKRSSVEQDIRLCEKYGYEYIELRLDMLKKYFENHTINDLVSFFASSRIKPYAFNSIENINFCTEAQWDDLVSLFTFGCETAQAIGNPYIIVVPTMGNDMYLKAKNEVFDDSVTVLRLCV
jgi:2-keto-myo-inositol isomerase